MFGFIDFIGIIIAIIALVMVTHLKERVSYLEQRISNGKKFVSKQEIDDGDIKIADENKHKYNDAIEYVKKQNQEGVGFENISNNLTRAGWSEHDISIVMSLSGLSSNSVVESKITEESVGEDSFTMFVKWFANDWLMKLGALLVLIAFGWFVTYAFAQNWIGPIGRITIGIVIGLAILLLGEWRIKTYKNQGVILLSLGSAGILMTIFAARMIYNFFTPTIALLFMFTVVVYMGLSSIRYKIKSLAVLSLILGFLIPILTYSSQPDFVGLFLYLLVVSGGVLWVSGVTGWRSLIPLSLIGMFLYSFAAFGNVYSFHSSVENFLFILSLLFAGMYFLTGMAAMVLSKKAYLSDLFTAVGIGAFTLMWITVHFDQVWWSFAAVALSLVFAVTAFAVYSITKMKELFYVYGGVALVLIGIATALELNGPTLAIAAIFESVIVVSLIKAVLQDVKLARNATLLFIIPGALSLGSIFARSWRNGIWHGDFAVLILMMISLVSLGTYFYLNYEKGKITTGTKMLFIFGSLYAFVIIWLGSHSLFDYDFAIMLNSIIYTVIGLYFYLTGISKKINAFKISGGILLGFVVIEMFTFALGLPLIGRVIIFVLIGTLLMSTAFIGKINNDKKLHDDNK